MSIVRKLDDVGRIAIPRDLRRALCLMGGDEIEISVNPDDTITLSKFNRTFKTDFEKMFLEFCMYRAECNNPVTDAETEKYKQMLEVFANS